ncbi:MAG: sel1 repeat family protein [Kiritimatiellae bacterium]|nr:sel1 repeat family protein [Kiritimatiellia bacterium]
MRLVRSKLLASFMGTMFCFSVIAQTSIQPQRLDSEAALDTIALINHINYSVEVIRSYNNVVALEEEYRNISADNLNLNRIPDEEALQLIRDILNTLNSMRMNERQRKWYQHILERDLDGAKLEGKAKMATSVAEAIVNGDGGLWSSIKKTVLGHVPLVTEQYATYKKTEHALRGQLEDKQFDLDTEKMNKLHEMNDMLLVRQWKLVQTYRLDDRLRVTGKDVKGLVVCLKDSNRKRCFLRLKSMERVFEVYSTYWYYRAILALATDNYEDALASCGQFEKVYRNLFRTDQMSANITMIKITALLQLDRVDKDVIRKGLEAICQRNYDASNADQSIFCTSIYLSVLDDPKEARNVLDPLMARLSADSEIELTDYCDLFTRPNERLELPPNTINLVQCRMLRLAIDQKTEQKVHVERLKEICERETTCSLEKLFYFGQLRIEDLWRLAEKDVITINLRVASDKLIAEIPVSWFLLGNMEMSIELLKGEKVLTSFDCSKKDRTHVMSRPKLVSNSKDIAYVRLAIPIEMTSLDECDGARLKLKHISWPVDILYASKQPFSKGDTDLVPIRVERFMSKSINKAVMKNPNSQSKEDFKEIKSAAENGDAEAQYKLALALFKGEGVSQDLAEGKQWLQKSAEQGFVDAQASLAGLFEEGVGFPKDVIQATKWYKKAAEQGNANAQLQLGIKYASGTGVRQDQNEAARWIRKSAEQGYHGAQYALGLAYETGEYIVKENRQEAEKWYRKAAEQGLPSAQYRLNMLHADARRRQVICTALLRSGIVQEDPSIGHPHLFLVAEGGRDLFEKVPLLLGNFPIIDLINEQLKIRVLRKDALALDFEMNDNGITVVLITAKGLFYIHIVSDKESDLDLKAWNWEEIKSIDWERTKGGGFFDWGRKKSGAIFINEFKLHFLENDRETFVEAMRKILDQIK